MSYCKLFLGICPAHERGPTLEQDGKDKIFLVGSTWKEQLIRLYPPPEECYIRLEPSTHPLVPSFEVAVTFEDSNEDSLAWSWEIETTIPVEWDAQSIDHLSKKGWLSDIRRKI